MSTVWVASIDHKHGTDLMAFTSEERARESVAEYAREWWADEMVSEGFDETPPTDDAEAVRLYFDNVPNEYYSVHELAMQS